MERSRLNKNLLKEPTFNTSFQFNRESKKVVTIHVRRGIATTLPSIIKVLNPDKCFVVCDANVSRLYATKIVSSLQQYYPTYQIVHLPNEANKNFSCLSNISEEFFAKAGTSNSVIIALGGGSTGNVAGLFASLAFRGIRLVHVPTTLLSQLDSAVDVKQSINSTAQKNSIGSYMAPDMVIIDPAFLDSLGDRELTAGIGEAVKHALAQDLNFVEFLLDNDLKDTQILESIIKKTISLKIQHWQATSTIWNDTKKIERLTHLGHTTGKILEMQDIDYLTHGEAIAHGIAIEIQMSQLLGYVDQETVDTVYHTISALNLLYPLNHHYTAASILSALYQNGDSPIYALLTELGNPLVKSRDVPKHIAAKSLARHIEWFALSSESGKPNFNKDLSI